MENIEYTTHGAGTFSFVEKLGPSTNPPHIDLAYNAKAYFLAGLRCLENIQTETGTQVCVGPGIVCHCFSIELLLKAILVFQDTKIKKVHKIADLMSSVNSDAVEKFRNSYESVISKPGFDSIVARSNDLFVRIRYEHEVERIDFPESEVQLLNKVIYEYCQRQWDLI